MPSASDAIQAIRRFAQRVVTYRIFTSDRGSHGTVTNSIIDEIVVATAHENKGTLASCAECQELVESRWGASLKIGEVLASFSRLVKAGRMVSTPTSVELTKTCSDELADRVRTAKELETTALAAWESRVIAMYPEINGLDLARLRDELIACIRRLIGDRGIEAAIVLYPEQRRFKHRLDEIMALSLSEPTDLTPDYARMRRKALKAFFDSMESIQRHWLLSLLSAAYLMSAFTLDPAAFDEVRRLTIGQRLYFDTNTLFPLLGLQGRRRLEEMREVIARSKLQGYELCITIWTLKELKRSIGSARKKIRSGALRRQPRSAEDERDLATARVMLKAYRRHCRDEPNPPSLDRYCAKLIRDAEYELSVEGVSVVDEGCDWVDSQEVKIEEYVKALRHFHARGERKSLPVEQHDAKIRILVERLRGTVNRSLSSAGHLFVTNDLALARYAAHPDPDATPFAVTVEAWLSRLRDLQPRVKDYDETLALMLDAPALHVPDILTHEQVMKVILQISAHERSTPEMNVRYLLDAPLLGDDELDEEKFDSGVEGDDREASLVALLDAERERNVALEKTCETLERHLGDGADPATHDLRQTGEDAPHEKVEDRPLTRSVAARWLMAVLCFCGAAALSFSALGGSVPRPVPWEIACLALALAGVGVSLIKGSWTLVPSVIEAVASIAAVIRMIKNLLT